ncbi:TetR/AcrR family transcriptional regulator [bacterium]|nr:TetR/AcrR family transcriptional regulator [bacterium]MBU1064476.1 TetR/AcrR family transcriptional regulator [bacterium]MBU1633291.1 TetR/AcrR family transcriptional regulator [bacterium]MBU1874723.1 TetR/AcrR family transcriptional regulator [bacterium]
MGIKERKEREKLQRRVNIIDAAEEVFFSKGYENSTMDDIAAKVELAKGTLYLYFNTKSEICLSIAVRGLILLREAIEKVAKQSTKSIEKLQELLQVCLQYQKEYPDYTKALIRFRDFIEQCHENNEMLSLAQVENDAIVAMIDTIIRDGITEKSIIANIDASKLSIALWGQMSGFLPNQAFERTHTVKSNDESSEISSDPVDYLYQLLIQGITC